MFYSGFQAVQACAVAADTLLIILTWVKTYRISREAMQLRMGVSISILLIRYGMYVYSYRMSRIPDYAVLMTGTLEFL